jgi:hypothetical protein
MHICPTEVAALTYALVLLQFVRTWWTTRHTETTCPAHTRS